MAVNPIRLPGSARPIVNSVISELFYEQWELPRDHFDVLTLIHVVDHLVDPMQVIGKGPDRTEARRNPVRGGSRRGVSPGESNGGAVSARSICTTTISSISKSTLRKLFEGGGIQKSWKSRTL